MELSGSRKSRCRMSPHQLMLSTEIRQVRVHAQYLSRITIASAQWRSQHTQASESSSSGGGEDLRHSSAAQHILEQARLEEEEEEAALSSSGSITSALQKRILEDSRKHVPWQGEESIEDAVLRMLTDKYYRPLRVPGTKRKIQQPSSEPMYVAPKPVLTVNDTVDQTAPDYRWKEGDPPRYPWEHTFRHPVSKDGGPMVKYSRASSIMPSPSSIGGTATHNRNKRATAGDVAARVYRARDASIDYQTGAIDTAKAKVAQPRRTGSSARARSHPSGVGGAPMPTSIKGWTSMVDERIELARQQGLFKEVKGRGKPIERDPQESNPFIGRSEFLLNRIVKRQEAAPPFVELQKEMRDDLNGFRARLRASWIRRATRTLCLQPVTPAVIASAHEYRDVEWEKRELGYHERTVDAVNQLIRRYNVVAPPSVRAGLVSVASELDGCYRDCGPLIKEELERRVKAGLASPEWQPTSLPGREVRGKSGPEEPAVRETMLSAFRRLVRETFAK